MSHLQSDEVVAVADGAGVCMWQLEDGCNVAQGRVCAPAPPRKVVRMSAPDESEWSV